MSDERSRQNSDALSDWLDGDDSSAPVYADGTLRVEDYRQFADELVVHGLLRDVAQQDTGRDERRIQGVLAAMDEIKPAPVRKSRPRSWLTIASGLAATAACVLVAVSFLRPTTANAAVALERIIDSVSQSIDRVYQLTVLEEYAERRRPQNLPREQWQRESEEELNGAMLYVGGVNRYVFVRRLKDGRARISGCDGKESWAFREDGPIHVSGDLSRFRGGLPGQQQSLGFADLHTQLTGLRDGYDVELAKNHGEAFERLIGERKSRDVRGPKRVEIDFDPGNGTIHRMVLDGLPRGRGGPKSVEFVLASQEEAEDKFYSHRAHHEAERRVKHEETQP